MTEAKTSSSRGARRKRLVLIGAGHAHLYTLKRAVEIGRRGFELIAIAPESFWYSGLATGVLGGHYAAEQDQVDVETLVKRGGGQFIRARIVAIEPAARRVRLGDGAAIGYDVLSLNLGSETFRLPGETERVFPIKPLRNLWGLRQSLEAARAAGHTPRVVIAGGGASGCEIAANVRALLGRGSEITILTRGPVLAPSFPPSATRALRRWLDEQGIDVRVESGVSGIDGNAAVTERGERFPFDYMVNATGLYASAILAQSGLPVSAHGELQVDEFLRSTGDAHIFGGGDCVCFHGRDLAKIGVYAVREAPVLFENLLATLEEQPLRAFHPQRNFLLILNLGHGRGLACWRSFHWLGRAAFWLKDRIDRAFLARYQRPTK